MKNKINLLSLDPMYSPLHWMIGKSIANKKYAVLSGLSLGLYLPGFKLISAHKLLSLITDADSLAANDTVLTCPNCYCSHININQGRKLNFEEINYMSKFYIAIKRFILEKNINLVILHNDTRWQHALAIKVCNELNIKYLVTEQGLIRPYTTVIDTKGCNANAAINFDAKSLYINKSLPKVRFTHESLLSKLIFAFYLLFNYLESFFATRLHYRHTDYALKKYVKRALKNQLVKKSFCPPDHNNIDNNSKKILLLLQIETDSQIVMYSDIKNNQQLIDKIEDICRRTNNDLFIKPHPADIQKYHCNSKTQFVQGDVDKIAAQADVVLTVNSSAALQVIKTKTPLFLLGDSMYAFEGVAEKTSLTALADRLLKNDLYQSTHNRKAFLNYLKNDYLLHGAGFSYDEKALSEKLHVLLDEPREKTTFVVQTSRQHIVCNI